MLKVLAKNNDQLPVGWKIIEESEYSGKDVITINFMVVGFLTTITRCVGYAKILQWELGGIQDRPKNSEE